MSGDARKTIEQLERQIVRLQRKALLGDLASVLVHEFNNLMTSALARVDFAIMTGREDATRKALETVHRQTHSALRIARRWIDLGQSGALELTDCLLSEAVEDAVIALARPLEKDGIELLRDVAADAVVRADRMLLQQFLMNQLHVTAGALRERGGRISITAMRGDQNVEIEICDHGRSFDATFVTNALSPFLAAPAPGGVAVEDEIAVEFVACRLIARWHAAEITARVDESLGTVLRTVWPAGDAAQGADEVKS